MNMRAACGDIAAFFSKGEVAASDPKGPAKEESGFTPTRKVMAAAILGLALVSAVAPETAQAGQYGSPAASSLPSTDAPVQGVYRFHDSIYAPPVGFDAETLEACLQKGRSIAMTSNISARVVCMDTRTGEALALMNVSSSNWDRAPTVEVKTIARTTIKPN